MKPLLLLPSYFPNIATFAAILKYNVVWEIHGNYQKQTYRNRAYIATDKGKHMINIPIVHLGKNHGRQTYADVQIDYSYAWQRLHWRTLETAYRTSPFFEYYEDEIAPLFQSQEKSLLEFNLKTIETICDCLQLNFPKDQTNSYQKITTNAIDARFLCNSKKKVDLKQPEYTQVFNDRNNFAPNLSILDLLFNEGTNTINYLKNINLSYLYA